jgi:hypothetical protein
MAVYDEVTAVHGLFVGDDRPLELEIFDEGSLDPGSYATDALFAAAVVAQGTMVNVASFAMTFTIRKGYGDADPVVVTKTTASGITVTGSFNATRASNTQRVRVAIEDTDTENLKPGSYVYTLKRTDAGNETTLSFGPVVLRQGTVR